MKTTVSTITTTIIFSSTLLALALADKPSPTYSSSAASASPPEAFGASPQASYKAEAPAEEAAEPVAPSTQGFYYYYYPVASSYDDNTVQNGQPSRPGAGGYNSHYAPDRQEQVGGIGSTIPGALLGVVGVIAAVAVGAAVFMSGSSGRRAFSDAFSSVDLDDVAYYVYEGIRLWSDVQRQ